MAHKQMPHRVSADLRTMGLHAHRTNCSVKIGSAQHLALAPFRMGLLKTLVIVLVPAKGALQALGATATMAAAHITESVENFLDVQKKHILHWYPFRKDAIVGMTHAAEMIQMASTVQETRIRAYFAKSTLYVA